jgi:hypothetical protein
MFVELWLFKVACQTHGNLWQSSRIWQILGETGQNPIDFLACLQRAPYLPVVGQLGVDQSLLIPLLCPLVQWPSALVDFIADVTEQS